jgi:hypothetical protein
MKLSHIKLVANLIGHAELTLKIFHKLILKYFSHLFTFILDATQEVRNFMRNMMTFLKF